MNQTLGWIVYILSTGSLLILAAAILIHVMRVRRQLGGLDPEDLKKRIAGLERRLGDMESELAERAREGAEQKIKTAALENDVKEVREESTRFLGVFKTVLYGFDYIVQGCKNALEIPGGEEKPPEKRITTEAEE